ncbi:MAG: hypothetical protein M1353_07850 [Nitrospirae bacterium]|nr:hypothetical protein [Nitrospirota bacterium]
MSKDFKTIAIPALMIIFTLLITVMAVKIKKDAAASWKDVVSSEVKASLQKQSTPSYQDMAGFQHLLEAIAKSNNLPVKITIDANKVIINADNTILQRDAFLENSTGIYQFLNTIAALPYLMQYTYVQIGEGASSGFDIAIQVNGI